MHTAEQGSVDFTLGQRRHGLWYAAEQGDRFSYAQQEQSVGKPPSACKCRRGEGYGGHFLHTPSTSTLRPGGKALMFSHGSEIWGGPDMAISMSTAHIHPGLHSLGAFSGPYRLIKLDPQAHMNGMFLCPPCLPPPSVLSFLSFFSSFSSLSFFSITSFNLKERSNSITHLVVTVGKQCPL